MLQMNAEHKRDKQEKQTSEKLYLNYIIIYIYI